MKLFRNIYNYLTQKYRNENVQKKVKFFVFAILFLFIISIGISPLHKISELNEIAEADKEFVKKYDNIYNEPEFIPLVREKIYKEALISLSGNDSINLIVNLYDSLICLSIKGVIIHRAQIGSMKIDPLLKKMPNMTYTKIFSPPIRVLKQNATIVKEPIVVRHAPKDTLEAFLNAYLPDTLVQNPAFVLMKLEHNFNLIFEQENNSAIRDKCVRLVFRLKILIVNSAQKIVRFVCFRKQEYKPGIIIRIPADDLRSIYRALPAKSFVVIYY